MQSCFSIFRLVKILVWHSLQRFWVSEHWFSIWNYWSDLKIPRPHPCLQGIREFSHFEKCSMAFSYSWTSLQPVFLHLNLRFFKSEHRILLSFLHLTFLPFWHFFGQLVTPFMQSLQKMDWQELHSWGSFTILVQIRQMNTWSLSDLGSTSCSKSRCVWVTETDLSIFFGVYGKPSKFPR